MIYAILNKKTKLIYFSDHEREEEDLDFTELLYTSDIISLEDIKRDLRPWVYLRSIENIYYKNVPEIKEYFETKKVRYSYNKVYPRDIDKEIDYFMEDYNFLCNLGCCIIATEDNYDLEEVRDNIKYDCDIYNYLEDSFGKNAVEIVFLYRSLDFDCKKFLREFTTMGTRDKKSDYIRRSAVPKNNPEVLEFLPLWYRLDYKMIGGYKRSSDAERLEYRRNRSLGDSGQEDEIKEKVKNDFFDIFKLGIVLPGYEIKRLIQEIYDSNGLKKTAKISDLYDYFEVTSVSSSSSYRIDLRK